MGKFGFVVLFLLFACAVRPSLSQQSVTPAQFNGALSTIATNESQWHKLIDNINIEGLPIAYAEGKQLDQNKSIVRQNLDMVVLWGAAAAKDKDSLYNEVNLMSSVQEFESQLHEFADLLLSYSPHDNASSNKITGWAKSLSALANGPINGVWSTLFVYTTNHAKQADFTCRRMSGGPSSTR